MTEWDETTWLLVGACALVLVAGFVLLALLRLRAASRHEVEVARAEAAQLRHRLDELERAVGRTPDDGAIEPVVVSTALDQRGVSTALDRPGVDRPGVDRPGVSTALDRPVVEGRLFADIVLRESVVRAASFVHGVRRALSPENRNRIAFEMRREVKRSRKARRVEVQEALRAYRARGRAATDSEDAA